MANAAARLIVNSWPNGSDHTQRRVKYTGICAIDATPALYPANGVPLTFYPMLSQGDGIALITNVALTTNVVTITAANTYVAGQTVTISGMTVATFLNGQTVTVLASGLSTSVFKFAFTHANVGSAADCGLAQLSAGVVIPEASKAPVSVSFQSITGGTYTYGWDSVNGTIRAFLAGTEATSASAVPALVSADTIQFVAEFIKDI